MDVIDRVLDVVRCALMAVCAVVIVVSWLRDRWQRRRWALGDEGAAPGASVETFPPLGPR